MRNGCGQPRGVAPTSRRSIRLEGYDYAQAGAYFVTICTQDRGPVFGDVIDVDMAWNDADRMVQSVWDAIPSHYPGVDVDAFIVMPNHLHGIFVVGAAPRARPESSTCTTTLSLPDVVHRFKSLTTRRYADGVKRRQWPPFPGKLWQRNYYEHIIRDEEDLNRIRRYIADNPALWDKDSENPAYLSASAS